MNILPVLAPLLVFGVVVFVHELGHFLAAKAVGIYAPVFSLGWGRRIWGIKRGETDYRLSMFPLGGYVRMASREDEAMAAFEGGAGRGNLADAPAQQQGEPGVPWEPDALVPFGPRPVPENRWFESKPFVAKAFVLMAGVTMNFILAIGVVMALVMTGGIANPSPVIGSVVPGSPAATSGLLAGDSILTIDKAPISGWKDLVSAVTTKPGQPLEFSVMRAGRAVAVTMTPVASLDTNPRTGAVRTVGRIGAGGSRIRLGVGDAFVEAVDGTWGTVVQTIDVVGGLLMGRVSPKQLGGPIMIAQASVQRARSGGLEGVLDLLALISVNIAVLNLLPIPVLDGGQVLLVALESARGRPLGDRAKGLVMYAGVGVVLLLLITTTFNDVARIGGQLFQHFRG